MFSPQSPKTNKPFIEVVEKNASRFGVGIRQIFDMGKMYQERGVEVVEDVNTYSILLCNCERSYRGIRSNPQRAAVLLTESVVPFSWRPHAEQAKGFGNSCGARSVRYP